MNILIDEDKKFSTEKLTFSGIQYYVNVVLKSLLIILTHELAVFFLVLDVDVVIVLVVVAGDVVVVVVATNRKEEKKDDLERGGKEVGTVISNEEEVELGCLLICREKGTWERSF